jgi:hypothetical protein
LINFLGWGDLPIGIILYPVYEEPSIDWNVGKLLTRDRQISAGRRDLAIPGEREI